MKKKSRKGKKAIKDIHESENKTFFGKEKRKYYIFIFLNILQIKEKWPLSSEKKSLYRFSF